MGSGLVARGWFNSLSILGLTLAWFTTYAVLCAVNGNIPSVTEREAPSRLFAAGGVFGMQRPVVEVAWRVWCAGWVGLAALGVCDIFYARHTKARYFALHVICNGWISVLCLPDLYKIATDPVNALAHRETVNHWPTSLVFSIHVYHMLFFRNLQFIDWLHHILMVVIGAPLLITGETGHVMNFNHFFMCGLPGGADYAMLFAVKHGWMEPISEKRYNALINVWIREPALVVTATLGFIQFHLQKSESDIGWGIGAIRVFLMLLAMWNGLFFMERVVGNYQVCNYIAKQEAKKQRSPPAADANATPASAADSAGAKGAAGGSLRHRDTAIYESSEHFTPGMMGMRVSVSTSDLQDIQKADGAATSSPRAPDAYPMAASGSKKAAKKAL